MRRLIYCSQACQDFDPDLLVDLLRQARATNERSGLSGMMLYCSRSFLQLLEGDEDALAETYERIRADRRHTNLRRRASHGGAKLVVRHAVVHREQGAPVEPLDVEARALQRSDAIDIG